ncbi:MAG TPA: NAD-dependent succinate-semialdehyde dehydrogenase [Kofleriaceae bacterium]|jgi:acyl-CoA reductase-like NAD-dependent aldehyde dehydrogenase|nr:NAD-dependent succinate-semialdehyde dehydrogenase [Kofleriaceae bacterium]
MNTQQFIDGAWVDALERGRREVIDPATEQAIASVAYGGGPDAVRAIEAAQRALPAWRARTAYDRGALLLRTAELIRGRLTPLAEVTVREAGKPIAEALREWQVAADFFEWYAEEGKRGAGYTVPARTPARRMLVLKEPIGVVGVITAWNFPAYNPARAIAAALAAGCTVVVRPAELTPLSAMALVEVLSAAGLPPGAVNLVSGEPHPIGQAMLDHPALRKLSFTGSVAVGKLLMDGASRTMTRLSLELGGNAPVLVLPDVDIESVARGAVAARFRNAGQVCVAPQRFYVPRAHAKTFEEIVIEETRKLPVGPGLEPTTRIGPMISARHRERVEALIAAATAGGAQVRTGGARLRRPGFFLEPTVLGDVTPTMPAFADEVFGPLFAMTAFDQLDEAIAAANNTRYGLAAYVFTQDLAAATRAYEQLDFGMIGVNEWAPQTVEAPFAGRKDSGVGHECGREGLLDNLETKLVAFGSMLAPGR